jgi:hypothetical protein
MDLALLKRANILVKKLYLHNATTSVKFNLNIISLKVII